VIFLAAVAFYQGQKRSILTGFLKSISTLVYGQLNEGVTPATLPEEPVTRYLLKHQVNPSLEG